MDNKTFEEMRNSYAFGMVTLRRTFERTTAGMSKAQKIIYATDMTFKAETLKKEIIAS